MGVLVAAVVLAWVAILLLGLAVGGLLSQIRAMEGRRDANGGIGRRLEGFMDSVPGRPHAVAIASSDCSLCHLVIPKLLAEVDGEPLVIVADALSSDWLPLPPSVSSVIDPGIVVRSGVPAVPWFVATGRDGKTIESFALGNDASIRKAAQTVLAIHSGGRDEQDDNT